MSSKNFYVYQYVDEFRKPYYIGKGKGKRIVAKHFFTVVPIEADRRQVIESSLTEIEALILENILIKKYGRKVDGGILDNIKVNRWACQSGWNHSEETKQKISKSTFGVKKTEKTKQNMRKPKSKEHAEKIRQANLGRPNDGRYEKIRLTMSLKRWYSNGKTSKMFEPGKEIEGFYPGRKIKGNNNVVA
jgi:hypothetical protein